MGLSNDHNIFTDFLNKFFEFLIQLLKFGIVVLGFIYDVWRKHQINKRDKEDKK